MQQCVHGPEANNVKQQTSLTLLLAPSLSLSLRLNITMTLTTDPLPYLHASLIS